MSSTSQYILSAVCASVICSICSAVTKDKKQANILVRLLSGIFLSITLLSPLKDFSIGQLGDTVSTIADDGAAIRDHGQATAKDAASDIINNRIEAYILQKAEQLGVTLYADITLGDTLAPEGAILTGKLTPFEKLQMEKILTEELGIPKEDLEWR